MSGLRQTIVGDNKSFPETYWKRKRLYKIQGKIFSIKKAIINNYNKFQKKNTVETRFNINCTYYIAILFCYITLFNSSFVISMYLAIYPV